MTVMHSGGRGSEDFGDAVRGKIWEERKERLACMEGGGCLWGQGLCQGVRDATARKEWYPLCSQIYSHPSWQEGKESGSRKTNTEVLGSGKQNSQGF